MYLPTYRIEFAFFLLYLDQRKCFKFLLAHLVYECLYDEGILEYVLSQRMVEHHGLAGLLAAAGPLPLQAALLHLAARSPLHCRLCNYEGRIFSRASPICRR